MPDCPELPALDLSSLPTGIISGEDVQLPDHSFRKIFEFVDLNEKDVFYHLGCGNGRGLTIALDEYGVKKAVGIDNDEKKIKDAENALHEKRLDSGKWECIFDYHYWTEPSRIEAIKSVEDFSKHFLI